MSEMHYILCVNSGSSSIKYALYRMGLEEETLLAQGAAERIGLEEGHTWIRSGRNPAAIERRIGIVDHRAAVAAVFEQLKDLRLGTPTAVGHRLVHGGPSYLQPALVDRALIAEIRRIAGYAPLHLPAQLDGIEAVAARYPGLPQVACFDTAFHGFMPELAKRFPLPQRYWEEGLQRYGFHGLSYEYVMDSLRPPSDHRIVIAHLGNGASLAAVHNGRPVDTTMGFTPTGGFMMGTRSGDLDPGILLYLMNEKGYSGHQLEELVNRQSGLIGVSGSTPDMQTLLSRRQTDSSASLAVDMFCYHVRKHIGSMAAVLDGLDTLVFTGGIGENAAPVRSAICAGLRHLGIILDAGKNATHADPISATESPCTVRLIRTNEDAVIARQTHRLLRRE